MTYEKLILHRVLGCTVVSSDIIINGFYKCLCISLDKTFFFFFFFYLNFQLENGFLSQESSKERLPNILDTILKDLNAGSKCTIPISMKNFQLFSNIKKLHLETTVRPKTCK